MKNMALQLRSVPTFSSTEPISCCLLGFQFQVKPNQTQPNSLSCPGSPCPLWEEPTASVRRAESNGVIRAVIIQGCLACVQPRGKLGLCKTTGMSTALPASSALGTEERARSTYALCAPPQALYAAYWMSPLISLAYLMGWASPQPSTRQRGPLKRF